MRVIERLLTPNDYSRPQRKVKEIKAIVMHWTANAGASAMETRNFFEGRKTGMGGYGSAHYIIDQCGDIVRCIPEDEVAYHCGSQTYTDWARKRLGERYVTTLTPNFCTIGIEMCNADDEGNFTEETVKAAAELCADICLRTGLKAADITTHHRIVGWKDCPRLWVNRPDLFEAFKEGVHALLKKGAK